MKHHKEAKAWIVGIGNPLYPNLGPPSGGNPSSVMLQIRETIWCTAYWIKKKKAIRARIYRQQKTNGVKLTTKEIDDQTISDLNHEKATTEAPDVIEQYFYPKFWLPFNYFGIPCLWQANSKVPNQVEFSSFRPRSSKQAELDRAERQEILRSKLLNLGKTSRRNVADNDNDNDNNDEENVEGESPATTKRKVTFIIPFIANTFRLGVEELLNQLRYQLPPWQLRYQVPWILYLPLENNLRIFMSISILNLVPLKN